MNRTDKIVKSGTSFTTTLVIIFAVLKFMGLSDMSWIWVISPWWLSFAVGLVAILFIAILSVLLDND